MHYVFNIEYHQDFYLLLEEKIFSVNRVGVTHSVSANNVTSIETYLDCELSNFDKRYVWYVIQLYNILSFYDKTTITYKYGYNMLATYNLLQYVLSLFVVVWCI